MEVAGLLTGEDATVRPGLATRLLADATPGGLAAALVSPLDRLGGVAWLSPGHHWAHELHHSGSNWASELLDRLGLPRPDERTAAALAFDDAAELLWVATTVWEHLDRADWACSFPNLPGDRFALATLHHHRQLWWRFTPGLEVA